MEKNESISFLFQNLVQQLEFPSLDGLVLHLQSLKTPSAKGWSQKPDLAQVKFDNLSKNWRS